MIAALFDELRDVAWIPCQDGDLRAPADVWLLPDSVPSVADVHVWLALPELVQAEVEGGQRSRTQGRAAADKWTGGTHGA